MIAAFLVALAVLPAPEQWRTFVNPRFEYSICYPAELRAKGPPPVNGDGRVFANGAAELRVWGQNNALEDDVASAMARQRGYLEQDGVAISYATKGADWFVLSGRKGKAIVYLKTRLTKARFTTFQLTYPAGAAAVWDKRITRIAACFRDTEAGE